MLKRRTVVIGVVVLAGGVALVAGWIYRRRIPLVKRFFAPRVPETTAEGLAVTRTFESLYPSRG